MPSVGLLVSDRLTSGVVNALHNLCQVVKQPQLLVNILWDVCLALQGALDASQALVDVLCVRLHGLLEPFSVLLGHLAGLMSVRGLVGILILDRPLKEPCVRR